jgi:hypothetical protein
VSHSVNLDVLARRCGRLDLSRKGISDDRLNTSHNPWGCDHASFITGSYHLVDGGYAAH